MKKQDIKYWLMGTACLGLLSTMTGCKEDDYPDVLRYAGGTSRTVLQPVTPLAFMRRAARA